MTINPLRDMSDDASSDLTSAQIISLRTGETVEPDEVPAPKQKRKYVRKDPAKKRGPYKTKKADPIVEASRAGDQAQVLTESVMPEESPAGDIPAPAGRPPLQVEEVAAMLQPESPRLQLPIPRTRLQRIADTFNRQGPLDLNRRTIAEPDQSRAIMAKPFHMSLEFILFAVAATICVSIGVALAIW